MEEESWRISMFVGTKPSYYLIAIYKKSQPIILICLIRNDIVGALVFARRPSPGGQVGADEGGNMKFWRMGVERCCEKVWEMIVRQR